MRSGHGGPCFQEGAGMLPSNSSLPPEPWTAVEKLHLARGLWAAYDMTSPDEIPEERWLTVADALLAAYQVEKREGTLKGGPVNMAAGGPLDDLRTGRHMLEWFRNHRDELEGLSQEAGALIQSMTQQANALVVKVQGLMSSLPR